MFWDRHTEFTRFLQLCFLADICGLAPKANGKLHEINWDLWGKRTPLRNFWVKKKTKKVISALAKSFYSAKSLLLRSNSAALNEIRSIFFFFRKNKNPWTFSNKLKETSESWPKFSFKCFNNERNIESILRQAPTQPHVGEVHNEGALIQTQIRLCWT